MGGISDPFRSIDICIGSTVSINENLKSETAKVDYRFGYPTPKAFDQILNITVIFDKIGLF